ncbi:MAG: hypothetical protein AB1768_20470, partial [Pseudomonadota bacterium]
MQDRTEHPSIAGAVRLDHMPDRGTVRGQGFRGLQSSSPTTKSGFMINQHSPEDNIKIRFYAKMTEAGSDAGNTLKSGCP